MDDSKIKNALTGAYTVQELDDLSIERIRRQVRAPAVRRRARRVWGSVCAAGTLCAASALAFPMIDANLFCLSLERQLNSPTAYGLRLRFLDAEGKPAKGWTDDKIWVYKNNYAVVNPDGVIYTMDTNNVYRTIDPIQKVATRVVSSGGETLFQLPLKTCERLSGLDAHRKLIRLGQDMLDGKSVSRYRLLPDAKGNQIEISILNSTGQPALFRQYAYDRSGHCVGSMEMSFGYDSEAAKSEYDRLARSYVREVDLSRGDAVAKEIGRAPKLSVNLGRDELTLYKYQRLPSGVVLLLYTFSGYHDGQQGAFVRLRDSSGRQWLPCDLNMSFSSKICGHQQVAEVFFPPVGVESVPSELFVLHDTWEVMPESYLQEHITWPGYAMKRLATMKPDATDELPEWFFFNSAQCTWEQLEQLGCMMQVQEALGRKDYANAVRLGETVLSRMRHVKNLFFFTKSRLILSLYFAHAGVGEVRTARGYLEESIRLAKNEPGQMATFYRDMAVACKKERIRLPAYLVE